MSSPAQKETHTSYGIGGAGNMRKNSDRSTAAQELTRLASTASASASNAADTTYSALTGANMGPISSAEYRERKSSVVSQRSASKKEQGAGSGRRKSSIVESLKGVFRKGSA